ncbi:MAG: flagellar biosynthesis protein FliQ [Fimbriimonadaceae bacterium]|nr:flagellar biosynthesis protein FliQ [Fimbriimonadaceae bacterium]
MDYGSVLEVTRQGFTVALLITLPILAVALFVGLAVSVLQAMTQVQEMTLTYVPKMIGAAIVVMMMGSWMLTTLVRFTQFCFQAAEQVAK